MFKGTLNNCNKLTFTAQLNIALKTVVELRMFLTALELMIVPCIGVLVHGYVQKPCS